MLRTAISTIVVIVLGTASGTLGLRAAHGQAVPIHGRYDAPAGAPYRAEQLAVRSPSGEMLGATLTLPCGAAGRLPAVVLITPTGPQDRDGAEGDDGYRPIRQIADALSRRGIAVLRVDDRGLHATGRRRIASVPQVAEDARAALALLRARPDIDPARLGLVGHSEGAAVAPLLAAEDSSLRAIVLLAAPAGRLRDALAEQVQTSVARDATLATTAARDSALRVRLAYQERVNEMLWPPASLEYDARVPARQVRRAAVLIVQGSTDRQVPAWSATALGEAFRQAGNHDVSVRMLPGIDHLLLRDADGDPAGYERLPSPSVADEVLGTVAGWAAERLGVRGVVVRGAAGVGAAAACRAWRAEAH